MNIPPKQLREARDEFAAMLQLKTKEAEWQSFFSVHPYVITPSLPLRLEPRDIIPLGRPGKTEPDLIFYSQDNPFLPIYGVIELKRPDQRIATFDRANVARLSAPAMTAVLQTKQYIQTVPDLLDRQMSGRHLFLGNNRYLFVIMGLSDELIFQPGNEMFWQMIRNELPGNLQILPYDILFRNFDRTIYPEIHILVPQKPTFEGFMRLRSQPATLSEEDVKKMLQEKSFYDRRWNFVGKGVKHQYQLQADGNIIYDATTGLTWQQSGNGYMTLETVQKYIRKLNTARHGGYTDWRLPTLEEAMSLMRPARKKGDLYIDSVFDKTQWWIWTADKEPVGYVWIVSFFNGGCLINFINFDFYVRAVRS